ncbi:hypothetical protein QPM17_20705 [Marinobacter sp. TBZ242]|uniref:Tetratricopeptide repeat protein n=1 Tax=Marinobacter azerbaijanicus TaxID=3050455 RepID=A0ABT7IHC1_9GAMM|nr:hypothetical protein [Marinobacter sp. TBZ242]MDL0433568.1 hypothetical protein [Marinobacter sp. TBZ242]
MTGNTRNPARWPAPVFATLALAALVLQGCAGGAVTSSVYAVSGAAAAKLHKERQEFREDLKEDYASYRALFSSSECQPAQYQISPEIIDYLESSAPTEDGYAEAQDILMDIYHDQTLSQSVRAHALYLAALTEAQKEDGSRARARDYLKRVRSEFPGTHDCAVAKLLDKGDRIQ